MGRAERTDRQTESQTMENRSLRRQLVTVRRHTQGYLRTTHTAARRLFFKKCCFHHANLLTITL